MTYRSKRGMGKKDRKEPLVSNWRSRLDGLTPIFDGCLNRLTTYQFKRGEPQAQKLGKGRGKD
jgi:hypothetical protein